MCGYTGLYDMQGEHCMQVSLKLVWTNGHNSIKNGRNKKIIHRCATSVDTRHNVSSFIEISWLIWDSCSEKMYSTKGNNSIQKGRNDKIIRKCTISDSTHHMCKVSLKSVYTCRSSYPEKITSIDRRTDAQPDSSISPTPRRRCGGIAMWICITSRHTVI